jgi:hypothetical protein
MHLFAENPRLLGDDFYKLKIFYISCCVMLCISCYMMIQI